MRAPKGIKIIFWDFDGVIMDSNVVRDKGFKLTLAEFPAEDLEKLMTFHHENGGLSRYVKFRYFFEEIRGEKVTEDQIKIWASIFSVIMKRELLNSNLLIKETIDFIKSNYTSYKMHIVSGSDQEELRYLCKKLDIDDYFVSIHGSPKIKTDWVKQLISRNDYKKNECLLIGDSINDYQAAVDNGIFFKGYNNKDIEQRTTLEFAL